GRDTTPSAHRIASVPSATPVVGEEGVIPCYTAAARVLAPSPCVRSTTPGNCTATATAVTSSGTPGSISLPYWQHRPGCSQLVPIRSDTQSHPSSVSANGPLPAALGRRNAICICLTGPRRLSSPYRRLSITSHRDTSPIRLFATTHNDTDLYSGSHRLHLLSSFFNPTPPSSVSWQPDMSQATVNGQTREELEASSPSLFDILHNSLVLRNTVPFLPVSSLLSLAATGRSFRALIFGTPGVFRHLDLTRVKNAQFDIDAIDRGGEVWRSAQLDENLTEDDFYSGPLRGVFSTLKRRNILRDVQTLILDGLSVTSELCYEIINDASFSVRILSIRDVKNLNQGKLRGALQYACRKTRPEGSPRLQALYVFGSKDTLPLSASTPPASSIGSGWNHKSQMALTSSLRRNGDAWWSKRGRVISRPISDEWVGCMVACEGIIAFDAVLCQGPRHRNSPAFGKTSLRAGTGPAVATHAVSGCEDCGKAPEGLVHPASSSPASLPLLAPPPLLSSSVRAATLPHYPYPPFVARCMDCLCERYCSGCDKWWCESCYQLPGQPGPQADVSDFVVVEDDEDGSVSETESLEALSMTPKIKVRNKLCHQCTAGNEPAI
ncbi:hypothetical protein TOPH_04616, partial [Tolypocladium ophioglossoides CBS 100239]